MQQDWPLASGVREQLHCIIPIRGCLLSNQEHKNDRQPDQGSKSSEAIFRLFYILMCPIIKHQLRRIRQPNYQPPLLYLEHHFNELR